MMLPLGFRVKDARQNKYIRGLPYMLVSRSFASPTASILCIELSKVIGCISHLSLLEELNAESYEIVDLSILLLRL